jgi:glycosyltransferase involved in cell wall biosynthesis
VRVLIFHGYLLRGTGSNVYNANLAATLVALGHEVHLLSQEREAGSLAFVDAIGTWERGALDVRGGDERPKCTVYRPDIGGLLPVYVADRYDGIEARPFPECSDEEVERYVEANVEAVGDVVKRAQPDLALANHLVMGPAILARALAGTGVPYAMKVHGSALEYTVKPHPRFLPWAREGLAGAAGVLVGSRHVARSLWAAMDEPDLPSRTRLGPPGVNVAAFRPRSAPEARDELGALGSRLRAAGREEKPGRDDSAFARDETAAAQAVEELAQAGDAPLVVYVGKFLAAKGIDLLLAAWPLVLTRVPGARLALVGFGSFEPTARELLAALAARDMARALAVARPDLHHLEAFLTGLSAAEANRYFASAGLLPPSTAWVGRLEHDELASLLPACEVQVVPSTFPEAFGMVAAEAAACGVLPVSAQHSGLAEVSETLGRALPEGLEHLLTFTVGPDAVPDIADRIVEWLQTAPAERAAVREGLVEVAREHYSWEGVARGVLAAAAGRLEELAAAD